MASLGPPLPENVIVPGDVYLRIMNYMTAPTEQEGRSLMANLWNLYLYARVKALPPIEEESEELPMSNISDLLLEIENRSNEVDVQVEKSEEIEEQGGNYAVSILPAMVVNATEASSLDVPNLLAALRYVLRVADEWTFKGKGAPDDLPDESALLLDKAAARLREGILAALEES